MEESMNELKSVDTDFTLVTAAFLAEIIVSNAPDKVRELRIQALKQLRNRLEHYKSLGYMDQLLCAIARKKAEMIMKVTTKTEMDKVMSMRPPSFDGNKFLPDRYNVPEEEIILWSLASLQAPLSSVGFDRYKELFEMLFPDQALEVFGHGAN